MPLILFLLSTFLDLLSIALVAPFISLIIEPENVFFGKNFINYFYEKSNFNNILIFLSLILILIFFLKFFFAMGVRFEIKKFSLKCRKLLQSKLLTTYQAMDYSDYNLRGSSEFIKNVRELSGDCVTTLESSLRIMSEALVLFFVIFYLFLIQPIFVSTLMIIIYSHSHS